MRSDTGLYENRWNGTPMDGHAWIDAILTQGWKCQLDAYRSGPSTIDTVRAGQIEIMNINASWQSVSPILHRISAP
ncbi:MAG TPA: hypothetical protein VGL08_13755, partial [Paraburkholderia sp.]